MRDIKVGTQRRGNCRADNRSCVTIDSADRSSKADIKSLEDAIMSEWQCFREGSPLTNRDVKQSTVILKQRPAKAYALIHFSKKPPHCLHLARYF